MESLAKLEKARARQQRPAREEESDHEKIRFVSNRRSVRHGMQEQSGGCCFVINKGKFSFVARRF
jgi:hypothetical protein